jgi:hypothetical protein
MGSLPAVREANWSEMASASQTVTDALRAIQGYRDRGEQAPQEVYLRLQENVERMRKYEYRTIGKMPTDAKHNGEYTHPITLANLMAAILSAASLPLDDAQITRINELGLAFESEFARMRERQPEGTPRVARMLAEYRLKGRFTDDILAVLTTEQRLEVVDPETKGLAGLDLHNPTLMILHTSPVITGASIDEIAGKLRRMLAAKLSLAESELSALDGPLEAWRNDVRAMLKPVPEARVRHYSYEDGDAAGRATVALTRRLLDEVPLSETARSDLVDDYAIYIPRLVDHQGG